VTPPITKSFKINGAIVTYTFGELECAHPVEWRVWQSNWQYTCECCKAIVPCPEGAMGGHLPPLRNQ
jgi:hypothetical protein